VPYEAIRQAYLVWTDAESEPFENPVGPETPKLSHSVAPPTCHVEESEGSGTSGARSTSSDSTAPLSPDHPLTHTTPVLVLSLCRTTCMAVRVPPAMMSTLVFVDPKSSTQADGAQSTRVPIPLPEDPYEAIRQAYLVGTDTDTTHMSCLGVRGFWHVRCEIHVIGFHRATLPDHPLTHTTPVSVPILRRTARMVVRVPHVMLPGLSASMVEVEAMSDSAFRKRFRSSYDSLPSPTLLVKKWYRGTSELILGTDSEEVEESSDSGSESEDIEDEGPTAEDEDLATEDEGLAAGVEGSSVDDESYGLDGEIHGVDDESHGLNDKSYGIDGEGHGIESDGPCLGEEEAVPEGQQRAVLVVGTAMSEPLGLGSKRVSVFRLPTLTTWTDPEDGMVYIDVPVYPPPAPPVQTPPLPESLEHEQERTVVTFGALWRLVLALEAWAGRVDTRMTDMSWAGYDDHRLVYDMLLQQTALQREPQEMRDCVTVLEQERVCRER
nr:hypothetical protein [Tanacetum cinerariifolium]